MKTNTLLAATLAVFVSFGAYAQTVDEIVDKHVTALGGMDKLNAVKTVVTNQTVSTRQGDAPILTTIVVGKAMRSEITIMGNAMLRVVDGTTGWILIPTMMKGSGEPEAMPADQLKQSMNQLNPFGWLVNYKDKGTKVELVGKEQIDKKDVYRLKITTKEGQLVDQYIDATTYLVSKVKVSMSGQDSEILFSDYKEVNGVKFPNTVEIIGGQMGTMTMLTNKITVNSPINEAIFKKPAK
mgnify:CR=1 FL=1